MSKKRRAKEPTTYEPGIGLVRHGVPVEHLEIVCRGTRGVLVDVLTLFEMAHQALAKTIKKSEDTQGAFPPDEVFEVRRIQNKLQGFTNDCQETLEKMRNKPKPIAN